MIIKGGLRWVLGLRLLHSTRPLQAIDKATLSKLRKKTGFPFINCKKALVKFDGDIAEAEKWLQDEAQKEGWAKATKLQDRPMSQGLIGIVVDNLSAALIEVNCETDFVSKNPKFQSLVSQAAALCLHSGQQSQKGKVFYDKASVNALQSKDGQTIADLVALEVGQLGENMAVRRALFMQAEPGQNVGTYVHATGPHLVKDNRCTMGRFGALLTFSHSPVTTELDSNELGRQLGQHIVGMNPQCIRSGVPDEAPKEAASEEEEANKPKEDDRSMLKQEFLLDESLTVSEFLQQNSASVSDFVRFECGEDLGDDDK